ncbi:MAG: 4Fe-4S binding protein [Candidatus Aenigmatarchaeota archaeon]
MVVKYQKIVIDRDICIACGACVAVCPCDALKLGKDGKPFLIWEKCKDAFECIYVCPVAAIQKSSEAPEEAKGKSWFTFERKLSAQEKKEFEEWKAKFNIKSGPEKFS